MEYTGLNVIEVLELPCDLFQLCVKNRVIERLQTTEEGRQYLEDCERYKQTKIDKEGLRAALGAL